LLYRLKVGRSLLRRWFRHCHVDHIHAIVNPVPDITHRPLPHTPLLLHVRIVRSHALDQVKEKISHQVVAAVADLLVMKTTQGVEWMVPEVDIPIRRMATATTVARHRYRVNE
jgi:hypothetical protein